MGLEGRRFTIEDFAKQINQPKIDISISARRRDTRLYFETDRRTLASYQNCLVEDDIPPLDLIEGDNGIKMIGMSEGVIIAELGESEAMYTTGLGPCTGIGMRLKRKDTGQDNYFAMGHFWDYHIAGLRLLAQLVQREFTIDSVAISVRQDFASRIRNSLRSLTEKGVLPANAIHFDLVRTVSDSGWTEVSAGILLTKSEGGFLIDTNHRRYPPIYELREKWSWADNVAQVLISNS